MNLEKFTAIPKKYRNNFLLLALLLFSLAILVLTTIFLRQRQEIRKKAAPAALHTAVLSLSASSQSIQPGQTTTVSLNVNPGGTSVNVDGVDAVLTFTNPSLMRLVAIRPNYISTTFNTFLPLVCIENSCTFDATGIITRANTPILPENIGRIEFGTVIFDMTSQNVTSPVTGNSPILLAELDFQAQQTAGSSVIGFDVDLANPDKTTDCNVVSRIDEGGVITVYDVLNVQALLPLTIDIVAATPTPTQTSIPTITPTRTPTPTSTLTPTATRTPTPTSTSTPTATRTPTPTFTLTPTPTSPPPTSTPTPTATVTNTPTPTRIPTPTVTNTPTLSPTPTATRTPTPTTPLPTSTPTVPTLTPTATATLIPTATPTPRPSFLEILINYFSTIFSQGDLNHDGLVNSLDFVYRMMP